MREYTSSGWSAMFAPSWTQDIAANGQVTAEEIQSLLEV